MKSQQQNKIKGFAMEYFHFYSDSGNIPYIKSKPDNWWAVTKSCVKLYPFIQVGTFIGRNISLAHKSQTIMQIMSILGDSSEVALPPLDAPMYVGVAGPAPPPTSPLSRPMSANSQGVAQPSSLPGDQAAQPGAEPEEEAARTCFCGFFIEVIPLV